MPLYSTCSSSSHLLLSSSLQYIMAIWQTTSFSENDYCVTPLHVAAASNNSAVVEILASNGGFLEPTTFYMLQTPLHYAARYDSPNSVRTLVKMGAKIEARFFRTIIVNLC